MNAHTPSTRALAAPLRSIRMKRGLQFEVQHLIPT